MRLIQTVKNCVLCQAHLPLGPRPILQIHRDARILIAGQAPGRVTHKKGIPFDDISGDRLRAWMGIDRETFYDARRIAIVPMGFCYPGTGKSGDLPPRPECAETWRERVMRLLGRVELTLVIGQYAMAWHLQSPARTSVTELVADWQRYAPSIFPLPHPSPRNQMWCRKNPWFETNLLPVLRSEVGKLL